MSKFDYRQMVWGTIRDYDKYPAPAVFRVLVYGVTMQDICIVGEGPDVIGSKPFFKAINRVGEGLNHSAWPKNTLSTAYRPTMWELVEERRTKKRV